MIPDFDPRHQVVKRVVQHLVDRNQDIEGIKSVPWTIHVIESPTVNASVMPVSESGDRRNVWTFLFGLNPNDSGIFSASLSSLDILHL